VLDRRPSDSDAYLGVLWSIRDGRSSFAALARELEELGPPDLRAEPSHQRLLAVLRDDRTPEELPILLDHLERFVD
jgi:hypothetical protein